MDILTILKYIAAIGTIVTGLVSLVRPHSIRGFTGLTAEGSRGVTEIRAIMGGVFIGAGMAPIILPGNTAFQMLGIIYLVIAAVRAVSMFIDKSVVKSNTISLLVEVIFGVMLVL
jgi:hypothetical protein